MRAPDDATPIRIYLRLALDVYPREDMHPIAIGCLADAELRVAGFEDDGSVLGAFEQSLRSNDDALIVRVDILSDDLRGPRVSDTLAP
jgi:hypothetical protein